MCNSEFPRVQWQSWTSWSLVPLPPSLILVENPLNLSFILCPFYFYFKNRASWNPKIFPFFFFLLIISSDDHVLQTQFPASVCQRCSLSLSFPSSARKLGQTIPLSKQSQLLVLSLVLPITLLKQPENGFLDPLLTRFIPLSSSPSSYWCWHGHCWTHCW